MGEKELRYCLDLCEEKLCELMGEEENAAFSNEVAKKVLRFSIENMSDCEFKSFCLENFDKITEGK